MVEAREVEEIPSTSSIPPIPAASGVTEAVRTVDQRPTDQKPNAQKTAEKE